MKEHLIYSCVVDTQPKFAYQAWHLSRSLMLYCGARPEDINIQVTPGVSPGIRAIFSEAGYRVKAISPFGDGQFCNKLAQLPNLQNEACDRIILLDTDMIAVSDIRPFIHGDKIQAKIVDLANPSLAALLSIISAAGGKSPDLVKTDASDDETIIGNANGGIYIIPRSIAATFSREWQKWMRWLMLNNDVLRQEDKLDHIDQVSAALTFQLSNVPYAAAPSNLNYFLHFRADHRYFDHDKPICLLHYHATSMNVLGQIEPPFELTATEATAVEAANEQIRDGFQNTLFWNYRYSSYPARGSGIGSRGHNAAYKRKLLQNQEIESFESILDVGCGDLEVLSPLQLKNYTGLDVSEQSLLYAKARRPDLNFLLYEGQDLAPADLVLCFEVLIHQRTALEYHTLLDLLRTCTKKTLIVSGYEQYEFPSGMIFFHEPLSQSLHNTKYFRSIQIIGAHSDVTIFRCDV